MNALATDTAERLVVVGAGPRAVMLLERLLAHLGDTAPRMRVTLVDPHPPGAGRIWRNEQSAFLKLNSMAQDVTVFTDDTSIIDGPVHEGPSLIEWADAVRSGGLPDVAIDDARVRDELGGLRGDSFPTRRLQSHYLGWFWRTTVAAAPDGVSIGWHEGRVLGVHAHGDGYEVELADGARLAADVVVYALGHNGRDLDAASAALLDAADRHGLHYVPPSFTADADLSGLHAGDDVLVRGMGLAAIDLVSMLTEGRGGRFIRDADGVMRYEPSGAEPRLHLGSRRGVPYRSKVSSVVQGAPPRLEVLTAEAVAALLDRPGPVDFDADIWPLIVREMTLGHYRELFTGHPDRVAGTWEEFADVIRSGDLGALRRAAAAVVVDSLDRFDVPHLDRPLGDERFADDAALQRRIRRHIADDLELRTTQRRSSAQALFHTMLLAFVSLADVPTERWSARSRAVSLPIGWHRFFSYVASGPPAHRLEELLALSRAGVVRFLGPDVEIAVDERRGFVASSPRAAGDTAARTLVDAWLPGSAASVSDNPALRDLAEVHGGELFVEDASFAGSLGRIRVDDDGRVVAPDGRSHPRLFAIGPFTSHTEAGAFTRPRANSLSLRQTDRVAGAVAARLLAPADTVRA